MSSAMDTDADTGPDPEMQALADRVRNTTDERSKAHFRHVIGTYDPQAQEIDIPAEFVENREVDPARLEAIQQIFLILHRREGPNFKLEKRHFASLMKIRLSSLQDLINTPGHHNSIRDILEDLHHMASKFLKSTKGKKAKNKDETLGRLASHANHARIRDENTCVLTRTAIVEIAHIFPFSATSSPIKVTTTQQLFDNFHWVMGSPFVERNKSNVKLRGTEAKWNMFGLDRKVHSWLDEGVIAFESTGVIDETSRYSTRYKTRLRFNYLPECKYEGNAGTPEEIAAALSSIYQHLYDQQQQGLPPREFSGPGYIGIFFPTGERVKSGSICYVIHEDPDEAYKCEDMIAMQWDSMTLLMMAGS